jgi:hypothetical protein
MAPVAEDNFLRKKHTSTIAFVVAVLLFALPFVEVRCNGVTVAQNTGFGLAFGSDYKLGKEMKSLRDSFNSERTDKKEGPSKDSGKFYVLALIALLLGVAGIAISFTDIRSGIVNTVVGALAALLLIGLMVQINNDFKERLGPSTHDATDGMTLSIAFTVWYYLSIISFLAAAFFSFKRGQLLATEGPPRHAPQLDIENPGEQSEFPKSASESEIG